MERRTFIKALAGVLTTALLPSLGACVERGYYQRPIHQRRRPYSYDYYYYPDIDVYFHLHSGTYYYRSQGAWRHGRRLPRHYFLDHRHRRKIFIRDPKPYVRHRDHRRLHPPPRIPHGGHSPRKDRRRDRHERDRNDLWHEKYRKRPRRRG